jgi:hypothetical protein
MLKGYYPRSTLRGTKIYKNILVFLSVLSGLTLFIYDDPFHKGYIPRRTRRSTKVYNNMLVFLSVLSGFF